jgi:opacity protein-like surface antigen
VPITATAKLVLPGGSIEPYLFGGVGLYLIRFEKDPTNGLPAVSERRNPVGFHAGLGAGWRAAERIRVGLEARYAFVRDTFFGSASSNAFDGIGLTASLGYLF